MITNLGALLAQSEYRMSAPSLAYCAGVHGVMTKCASAKRLVLAAAAAGMLKSGRGHTAPYHHLEQVLELTADGSWTPHAEDVYETILTPLMLAHYDDNARGMRKMATPLALSGLGLAGKGLGYAALGSGVAAGILFNALSRHANQDDADTEAMKKQRDYYTQLTAEMEDAMRREYPYEQAKAKKPAKSQEAVV